MIVYKATNIINGKTYIGITIHTLKLRRQQHINEANIQRNNMPICRAINKYGIENFDWEVIYEGNNREELQEREKHYIALYDSYNNGYNATIGGEGVIGTKLSEDGRQRKIEAMTGKNNPMYGKPSPMRGKKVSAETRRKNSESHKGKKLKPFTESHKQKMREGQQGEKGSNAKLTESDVLNIRELYANGNHTQKRLAEMFGIVRQSVSDIVNKKTWKHI